MKDVGPGSRNGTVTSRQRDVVIQRRRIDGGNRQQRQKDKREERGSRQAQQAHNAKTRERGRVRARACEKVNDRSISGLACWTSYHTFMTFLSQ
jgi:hypothetical protein